MAGRQRQKAQSVCGVFSVIQLDIRVMEEFSDISASVWELARRRRHVGMRRCALGGHPQVCT